MVSKVKEKKERLDVLLVKRGLMPSREKAKAVIMAGEVFVDNQREDKAGQTFPESVQIEVRGKKMKYVSRGGYKLEQAMNVFPISLTDTVCMDVGSSTGGFTDCMLQNGAKYVYAIDVGTNQLAWSLRQDERVCSMEKTNIRYVTPDDIGELVDFVSIDVAFISLTKVLEPVKALMKENAQIVCLIKHSLRRARTGWEKRGRERARVHEEVIQMVMNYALSLGFHILGIDHSPIRGPEGNIEYLLYMENDNREPVTIDEKQKEAVKELVAHAHEVL